MGLYQELFFAFVIYVEWDGFSYYVIGYIGILGLFTDRYHFLLGV